MWPLFSEWGKLLEHIEMEFWQALRKQRLLVPVVSGKVQIHTCYAPIAPFGTFRTRLEKWKRLHYNFIYRHDKFIIQNTGSGTMWSTVILTGLKYASLNIEWWISIQVKYPIFRNWKPISAYFHRSTTIKKNHCTRRYVHLSTGEVNHNS